MYSKFISIAFVLAATLAPTSAVVFPRGSNEPATTTPTITPTVITTPPPTTMTSPSSTPTTSTTPSPTTTSSTITPTSTLTPTTTSSSTITPTTTLTPTTTTSPKPPVTTPTPTTTPTTPTTSTSTVKPTDTGKPQPSQPSTPSVSCNGVQPWQVNLAYSAGAQVIFNNQLWTANQWSYNNNPESAAGAWTVNGFCSQPISNKVDCTAIPAWNQPTAYPGGSKVTFNGHLWISTQWTQSNKPGDTSGTWKDLGACN